MLRPLGAISIDLAGVEALALLGIRKQIVRSRDFLEFVFGRLVARIEIRVQLLRQLSIGLLDIGRGRRRGNAKDLVRISHNLLRNTVSAPAIIRAQKQAICKCAGAPLGNGRRSVRSRHMTSQDVCPGSR
ncbi:hypothetical protein ABIF23_004693 [Bradyrhizobium elkanii]